MIMCCNSVWLTRKTLPGSPSSSRTLLVWSQSSSPRTPLRVNLIFSAIFNSKCGTAEIGLNPTRYVRYSHLCFTYFLNCRPFHTHNQFHQCEQGGENSLNGDSCAQGHCKGTLSHAVSSFKSPNFSWVPNVLGCHYVLWVNQSKLGDLKQWVNQLKLVT